MPTLTEYGSITASSVRTSTCAVIVSPNSALALESDRLTVMGSRTSSGELVV